jgi:hypothetical protein
LEDEVAVEGDVDMAGREGRKAASVAELADGDQGCIPKGGEEVGFAGCWREVW